MEMNILSQSQQGCKLIWSFWKIFGQYIFYAKYFHFREILLNKSQEKWTKIHSFIIQKTFKKRMFIGALFGGMEKNISKPTI